MIATVLKTAVRRETHSPRTVATVLVLVLLAAGAVYAGVEIVLHLFGAAPLLAAPGAMLLWAAGLPDARPQAAVVAGGAAVALVGAALLWSALSPGRRPKHRLGVFSDAVVVDNAVIASAIAERVRRELNLPKDGVIVGVSHRGADVTVRPEPGQELTRSTVRSIAEAELSTYGTSPELKVRARVSDRAATGGSR